jgi:hypothetical protein
MHADTLAAGSAAVLAGGNAILSAAQSADSGAALDIISTGSQLTVVGALVLIAHRFATGQLISRDTAASLARQDQLIADGAEREERLERVLAERERQWQAAEAERERRWAEARKADHAREERLWNYLLAVREGRTPDAPI